jgi:hypothetical protein
VLSSREPKPKFDVTQTSFQSAMVALFPIAKRKLPPWFQLSIGIGCDLNGPACGDPFKRLALASSRHLRRGARVRAESLKRITLGMTLKIFISYRRQDSGANAIGIGQYLEKEFGRKNVYIDVEMQAGTKYPDVIERRLAECKVLLVLIGPGWLGSKDEQGHLRLQKPDDWVRLEIAHALKRDITVIPVLINGAQLPDRETLPDDIQGLLDHQVASVSVAGFRHEMAGLVRDIRSIKIRRSRRLFVGTAAAALILLIGSALAMRFGIHALLDDGVRIFTHSSDATKETELWKSQPGEWVLYAVDSTPSPYYLNTHSVKTFGNRASYTARFVLKSSPASFSDTKFVQGAYEDDNTVLDCGKQVFVISERTVYSRTGETLSHFKLGAPESVDLGQGQSINPGSILAIGQRISCDEKLRSLFLSKRNLDPSNLSYLSNTPNGDGTIFHAPISSTSDPTYSVQTLLVTKFYADHEVAEIFPGQNVRGLASLLYRSTAQDVKISCAEKRMTAPILEYYDKEENLNYLAVAPPNQTIDVKGGIVFTLFEVACGAAANVGGNYEGMNDAKYSKGGDGEQKIAIFIQQNGSDLKVRFESPLGGQGEGTGTLKNGRVDAITLHSTAPGCPGSYEGSLSFTDNEMNWSYKGEDCGGPMEGHGTATKVAR